MIHNLCWMHRRTPEDRRDLFQDILYELFKGRASFKGKSNLSTWIYSVAFNTATDIYYKHKAEIVHISVASEIVSAGEEWAERRGDLLEAMRFLTTEEQSILILYMEQLSYEEIAKATEISVGLVGVRLHRIKTKIRNILKNG